MATRTKTQKNRPVHELRSGLIRATIWLNTNGDKSAQWYSVNITRSYRVGDEWKETTQFNRDDLLAVAKLSELAFSWIQQQSVVASA